MEKEASTLENLVFYVVGWGALFGLAIGVLWLLGVGH